MRLIARVLSLALLVALAGCHALRADACYDPQAYETAVVAPPLKAADGLPAANTKNSLKIPDETTPYRHRTEKEGCLERPPSFYPDKPKPVVVKPGKK